MGLDMYLERDTYIGKKEYRDFGFLKDKTVVIDIPGADVDPDRVTGVTEEVAYWRKANAIHKWFVDHVQDGVDECQRAFVPREKLQELYNLVCSLLEKTNDKEVLEKLPPQSGFFFGSTEIDEYYWQDLENTRDQLKPILERDPKTERADYYYHSSW